MSRTHGCALLVACWFFSCSGARVDRPKLGSMGSGPIACSEEVEPAEVEPEGPQLLLQCGASEKVVVVIANPPTAPGVLSVDPQLLRTGEVEFDVRDPITDQPAQRMGCKVKWIPKGETVSLRPGEQLTLHEGMACLVDPGQQVRVTTSTTGLRSLPSDSKAPLLPKGLQSNAVTLCAQLERAPNSPH